MGRTYREAGGAGAGELKMPRDLNLEARQEQEHLRIWRKVKSEGLNWTSPEETDRIIGGIEAAIREIFFGQMGY